jgi:hypothetical protein
VEIMFPIEDEGLRNRMVDEILATALSDNVKARRLMPDGSYQRLQPGPDQQPVRSQARFIQLARDRLHPGDVTESRPAESHPGARGPAKARSPAPEPHDDPSSGSRLAS